MQNDIVIKFENQDYAIIEKPAGIVVNKADSQIGKVTIQAWAEETINKIELEKNQNIHDQSIEEFVSRGGVVHRLDKETSGLLIIAKNPESFQYLKNQFKDKQVSKTYKALVHGHVVPKDGEVSLPIGRLPWNRMRFGIIPDGRNAHTVYKVVEYYNLKEGKKEYPLSLLEVYPKTGRTHQIRVHTQSMNCPIFADALYAGRKQSKADRKILARHFLHASSIAFIPPGGKALKTENSDLPPELADFLTKLTPVNS